MPALLWAWLIIAANGKFKKNFMNYSSNRYYIFIWNTNQKSVTDYSLCLEHSYISLSVKNLKTEKNCVYITFRPFILLVCVAIQQAWSLKNGFQLREIICLWSIQHKMLIVGKIVNILYNNLPWKFLCDFNFHSKSNSSKTKVTSIHLNLLDHKNMNAPS